MEGPALSRYLNLTLEDKVRDAILRDDYQFVVNSLARGADPNKVNRYGKTSLGEAAVRGNYAIAKLLIDATKPLNNLKPYPSPHQRHHKKKIRQDAQNFGTVLSNIPSIGNDFKGQKYARGPIETAKHEDSSSTSSDDEKKTAKSSPCTSPQADLEWDEDLGITAPNTIEDETWSSLYSWYAGILEYTGTAIESASRITNGIDQQDEFLRTALHLAVEQSHTPVVKALLDAGCKVDIVAADGLTPLYFAILNNNMEIAEMLISAGCNINYQTYKNITPLHFASSRGVLNMVKTLVTHGAFIESRDTNDRTPLYLAAERGYASIVEYLISIGANVNGESIHGDTPLCEAVWHGFSDIVGHLLMAGARVTHSHKLLHTAVLDRNVQIVRMLAATGFGINLHNDNGDTPLLLAVRTSQPEMVRVLLENGADANVTNNITWCNALHVAVDSIDSSDEFREIFFSLLDHNINMDTLALSRDSALNRALVLEKDYAALLLIRHGAEVNTSSEMYALCLDNFAIACRRKKINLALTILKAGLRPVIPKLNMDVPTKATLCWLSFAEQQEPLLLTDICRIKIRKMGSGKVLFRYIESLPLPNSLKRFLMMENDGA